MEGFSRSGWFDAGTGCTRRAQLANLSPGYLDKLGCIRADRAQGWAIFQFMLAASVFCAASSFFA